jgi:hypothetical protein
VAHAMPLEGHYERQTTPLRKLTPRELKAAFGVLGVTLTAMLVVILMTVGDSPAPVADGCIKTEVAGIVGAETIGARAETVLSDCRARGIKF